MCQKRQSEEWGVKSEDTANCSRLLRRLCRLAMTTKKAFAVSPLSTLHSSIFLLILMVIFDKIALSKNLFLNNF